MQELRDLSSSAKPPPPPHPRFRVSGVRSVPLSLGSDLRRLAGNEEIIGACVVTECQITFEEVFDHGPRFRVDF